MYHAHFGLRESPFTLTPDPRYLFMSDRHKEALASAIYGVQERKGFVLILGEVGTGKTTLIRHLLGHFGDNVTAVYTFDSMVGFDELLQGVLRKLKLPCPSRQRLDMIETLHDYLLRENAADRYVVLIVDEAQHLSPVVLEELRMLSNLETSRSKLLQIILVGQPELAEKLGRPSLRQFRQRIGLVAELKPLTLEETQKYIVHRLEVAGREGRDIFTRSAVKKIQAASGGIPRLVNVLCDKSLVLAYGDNARQVGGRLVKQVAKDWAPFTRDPVPLSNAGQKRAAGAHHRMRPSPRLRRVAAGVVVSLGAIALAMAGLQWYPDALGHLTRSFAGNPATLSAPPVATASLAAKAPPVPPRAPASAVIEAPSAPPPEPAPQLPERTPATEKLASPLVEGGSGAKPLVETRAASAGSARAVEPAMAPSVAEVFVRPGDTLNVLALEAYGRADMTILDHVKMANPSVVDINVIEVGKRLRFPRFDDARMVHREGDSHYVAHVRTVARADTPELDKLRAFAAKQGRKLYVVPVRFTADFEVYRVLVGDFAERAQAEKFLRGVPTSLQPVDLVLGGTR